ncbi:MAG: galactose mutarotase [Rhodobacterales bacterium]|nr:galactose mutarotase [Rhodobacterales bacterium]
MPDITSFGQIGDTPVNAVTLTSAAGLRLTLISLGARLTELWVPDHGGTPADIVLGHDTLQDYLTQGGYLGATCGRYSNRIAGGRFVLDGQPVNLDRNEGDQHLHGGAAGFDLKVWDIESRSASHVTFCATSADGEMGFPGAAACRVTYRINGLTLEIEMEAEADAPTVINMVNHAYFNLAGHGSGDVLAQHLQVDAGFYLPVDERLIPTGEVVSVEGTAFDFRRSRPIGARMPGSGGFDHTLCLSWPLGADGLRPCLEAVDPASGRRMRMASSEPGVQLYTGAHFNGGPGKSGTRHARFAGFAVETQRFPDSPNRPHFPSARLDPGQIYRHRMKFDFSPAEV